MHKKFTICVLKRNCSDYYYHHHYFHHQNLVFMILEEIDRITKTEKYWTVYKKYFGYYCHHQNLWGSQKLTITEKWIICLELKKLPKTYELWYREILIGWLQLRITGISINSSKLTKLQIYNFTKTLCYHCSVFLIL